MAPKTVHSGKICECYCDHDLAMGVAVIICVTMAPQWLLVNRLDCFRKQQTYR